MQNYKFNLDDRIEKIVKECIEKLNSLGVPISKSIYFSLNGGFSYYGRTHFGVKIKHKYGCDYYITINKFIIDDKDIIKTVVHELLHTVKGGMYHSGEWKRWKLFINKNTDFKITILSKVKLAKEAYKNKKVFDFGDYNSLTMDLLECPKCKAKLCVKKGTCKTKTGKCKYLCAKCRVRFKYV
jgi:hypothetical protein